MTALCRRKTLDAKKTLYVVVNHGKQEGLRAPKWILHQVFSEEKATRERRRGAVERRDAATEDAFAATIKRLFANIPEDDLNTILRHALRKRSGRVGRTGKLELDKKAYLAVQAHIRHRHTDYDKITKASKDRDAARDATRGEVSRILLEWGSDLAVMKLSTAVRKDKTSESRRRVVSRVAQKRRASLTAAIKPTLVSRRTAKQHTPPKASGATATQSQTTIIDLTQDEDETEESDATDNVSSVDEDQDSEEDGDASYELSDSVDSDKEYEIDNDWVD
jgi:hypothetical protein